MAALSHIKNRRNKEKREAIEDLIARCGLEGPEHRVGLEMTILLELLDQNGIKLEEKESLKLATMAGDNGLISREDFANYAKHSKSVKLLMEKLERQKSRPTTPKPSRAKLPLPEIDQAKAAFKAIDKDHSGFIDEEEFGAFCSKISPEKKAELMKKLDKDGDGRIDLEEFRLLFKHKLSH